MDFEVSVLPPKAFLVGIIPYIFIIILFVFLGTKIIKYFKEIREVLKGLQSPINEINKKLDK